MSFEDKIDDWKVKLHFVVDERVKKNVGGCVKKNVIARSAGDEAIHIRMTFYSKCLVCIQRGNSDNNYMQRLFKRFFVVFAFAFAFPCFFAFSESVQIKYSGNRGYTLVERTNLRRYVNGKYSGLTSREVRSFISAAESLPPNIPEYLQNEKIPQKTRISARKSQLYDGNFYVMEETLRNSKSVAAGIHKAIPSVFYIDSDGQMKMVEDNGYPTFRSFPSYTTQNLKSGDSWKAQAERAVDPLNKGVFTRIPIQVLYTFSGEETYKEEKVYRIKAIWQTNYGFSSFYKDMKGDDSLQKATGGHKADIIVRKSTGEAILINDSVDETFFYSDGSQVAFKGTITLFTEYPPAVDRSKLLMNLQRVASISPKNENQSKNQDGDNAAGGFGNASRGGTEIASAKGAGASESSKNEIWSGKTGKSSETKNALKDKIAESEKTHVIARSADDEAIHNYKTSEQSGQEIQDKNNKIEENAKNAKNSRTETSSDSGKNGKSQKSERENVKNGKSQKIEKVSNIAAAPKNNMLVEETSAGVRLSIRDIKFLPDSAQIVSGENSRLDDVAAVLKTVPNQLLIEGHTASVGKPAGEQKLSVERAESIAAELVKRGISADRLICKGWGGIRPVADNSTDSGRAQNRRVEITILE